MHLFTRYNVLRQLFLSYITVGGHWDCLWRFTLHSHVNAFGQTRSLVLSKYSATVQLLRCCNMLFIYKTYTHSLQPGTRPHSSVNSTNEGPVSLHAARGAVSAFSQTIVGFVLSVSPRPVKSNLSGFLITQLINFKLSITTYLVGSTRLLYIIILLRPSSIHR